jgi:acyl-CoA reductase-like NAD-dependent aldehyde dehydrogenase
VVANISAWNYPYFVGSNVFVPALIAGNAVLYKPSEFATLTGLHIAEMLHEAGVPRDAFVPVVGDAATAGRRMIKAQLELGGKDPVYVCEDVEITSAAAAIADGAFYNTGQSCCSVERIYVHEAIHDTFVAAFVGEVKGYRIGDPMDEATYIGAITRRAQLDVLKEQVADETQGSTVAARRLGHPRQGQLVRADRVRRRRSLDAADARGELWSDHRHSGRRRR